MDLKIIFTPFFFQLKITYLMKQRGASSLTLWPCHFILEKYLMAKEDLYGNSYISTMQKIYSSQKKNPPLKETKILQDIIITL